MDFSFLVCSFKVWNGHHPDLCIFYGPVISQYLIAVVRLFLKLTNNLRFPASIFAGNAVKWLCESVVLYVLHVVYYWVWLSLALWLPVTITEKLSLEGTWRRPLERYPLYIFLQTTVIITKLLFVISPLCISVKLVPSFRKWDKIRVVLQSRLKKLSLMPEKMKYNTYVSSY